MKMIKKSVFILCTLLSLMVGCTNHGNTEQGSEADSIYTWEYIRQSIMVQPEHALGLVDTAQMKGVADANYANWMRAQIYLVKGSKEDIDKAREYCMAILNNQDQAPDSLQRVRAYHLLTSIGNKDSKTYQDAISYAIEGAKIAHEYGWNGEEAMFYFEAGETMEKVQTGSGVEYLDRSLDLFRSSTNIQAMPMFSAYLGSVARHAINHGDFARALKLTEERLPVIDRIEKEYTTAPAGFVDQQRAYIYSIMAYCQYQLGDKAAASHSAQLFENLPCSQLPDHQSDILSYYILSGSSQRISQICAVLEPYYKERMDTISIDYASWLKTYAMGLDKIGKSHEAYEQLLRNIVLTDSLVQRERQAETLKYAQQMKTQEKEMLLKDEETKSTIYRILAIAAALISLLIGYLFWRTARYNKVLLEKNRRLVAEIDQREQEEQLAIEQLKAEPEERLTTEQQLFRRICDLMAEKQPYTDETLNREILAQMLATNAKYVEQAIRDCSRGETVNDFITRHRLEHVARLLKTTDDSVAIIGEMAGIPSRSTLARLFRNAYGMTCTEYRQVTNAKKSENS